MNLNYKGNGGKKAFLVKPKHQYCVSKYTKHNSNATKKKNGDYYKYLSLYHFMDDL